MNLEDARQEINEIDRELIALLSRRMHVAHTIQQIKAQNQQPIKDIAREQNVLQRVAQCSENATLTPYLQQIYQEIMNITCHYEMTESRK